MIEKEYLQIKFVGSAPNKKDYCYATLDENISNNLITLLSLEEKLSQELSVEQRENVIVAHIRLWNRLPYYYKSELADLTAIYS